ncbi:ABC transporter permease [Desulfosporosinus sp. Sb-LF]|uniref:ABC transporter permease n=1 Tax=Desulfosporosinus sp. Sb-LF TaxID=2560027 RepID=UPI00107FD00C|nr:ABC transporter permease [Desulfosporosinus sp. Sb-LF]TGE31514.1 ABC transporter permease [Desulfosporosinus sp. Sb-LF]
MSRLTTDQSTKTESSIIRRSWQGGLHVKLPGWERLASGLVGLFVWQTFASLEVVTSPYILWQKFINLLIKGDPLYNLTLIQMIWTSLATLLVGAGLAFAIAIPLGIMLGYFRGLNRFLGLYISLCRPIPPMAWIPVGYILFAQLPRPTLWVQIMVVFVGSFFPCFNATAHAVQSADPVLIEAAQTLGARRQSQILVKVLLPSVVPAVISGVRSGLGVGWMCIIGAEFVGGRMGIGAYIWSVYNIGGRMSEIMIAILSVGLIGYLMNEGINLIGRRIARWYSW